MKIASHRFKIGSGWNTQPDPDFDSDHSILFIFSSLGPEGLELQLRALREQFPRSLFCGCSTSGDIYQDELSDESIVVSAIRLDQTRIREASARIGSDINSTSAGHAIAEQLAAPDLKAVFVLSDGLLVNGTQLVQGLTESLDDSVVITGGLAGDGDRFVETWVMADGGIQTGYVTAIGFYGEKFRVAHGSRGGWDLLGPQREVTRSHDNVLFELDGQPALSIYKKYLGKRADELPATGLLFPLAIDNTDEIEGDTVRTILAVDEEEQSITFAGDIPQGSFVHLMHANFDRLIDGASRASEDIRLENYRDQPALCVAISCVGRRLVLGQRTEEEIDAVLEFFPDNVNLIGFYSYGEISPLASGRCDLHNQTMTLSVFWEDLAA